jgi:hypothetical protein
MIASRRNFLAGFGSLLAAPAIVRADSLMKLHHIPERWATVWGVGHDFEVVEVPLWEPMSAAQFSGSECVGGHIDKFREVTDWVYTNPSAPLTAPLGYPHWENRNHWSDHQISPAKAFLDEERRKLAKEPYELIPVVGYKELEDNNKKQLEAMFKDTMHLSF